MRRRPSSRLLVLDPTGRLLLFRFLHKKGALAGQEYWATPGGEVESCETFTEAAIRELREETGMVVTSVGDPITQREFTMQLPDGEDVVSEEQFFVVLTTVQDICRNQHTALELEVMADHKWWTAADLESTDDTVWPDNLPEMLTSTGWW